MPILILVIAISVLILLGNMLLVWLQNHPDQANMGTIEFIYWVGMDNIAAVASVIFAVVFANWLFWRLNLKGYE